MPPILKIVSKFEFLFPLKAPITHSSFSILYGEFYSLALPLSLPKIALS